MSGPKTPLASGLPCSMPHPHFQKAIDSQKLAAEIQRELGIILHSGDRKELRRHGHISTLTKKSGRPFGHTSDGDPIITCPMCETDVAPEDMHACCEIVLYEEGEEPNDEHETKMIPHGLDEKKVARLAEIVAAHRA